MGNPNLEALDFDGERGIISFKGVRYPLLRPETLAQIASYCEQILSEPIKMIS
jgi:hypothetical protein